jgi:selenocysteine lyase/cysteine desulfurase
MMKTATFASGPRCHDPIDLLTEGGDERIILDGASGVNRYGCGPAPDDEAWAFGSSTASVISEAAYEAVLDLSHRFETWPTPEAAYADGAQRVRERLAGLCGIAEMADDIILGASGTDLHLIAAELAKGGEPGRLTSILPDPAETGRGVGDAVRSLRFAERTPHGEPACAGPPLAGVAPGRMLTTPLRAPDGAVRPIAAVDRDVERAVGEAMAADGRAMLVLVDVSKTGLVAPSPDCASRLKRQFGQALTVFVDACQFRISAETVADYLDRDFLVALTGSKFIGGPAFSGALLIPPASASRMRGLPMPASLSDTSGRQDWPAAWRGREDLLDRPNLGLLLRWEAALHELAAFRALPPEAVDRFMAAFAARVDQTIDALPNLERLAIPPLARPRSGWDARQTIFPFLVVRKGAPLDPAGLQRLYQQLQSGRRAVCLGQPVPVGRRDEEPVSALRLSLSARLVVEALTTSGGEAAVINRAALALVRTAAASAA